jgi:hypothetical protein
MKFFGFMIIFCLGIVVLSAPSSHNMIKRSFGYNNNNGYYNNNNGYYNNNNGYYNNNNGHYGGYLRPYSGNPQLFIQYSGTGASFIRSCGPGTVFNPRIGVCDYPSSIYG